MEISKNQTGKALREASPAIEKDLCPKDTQKSRILSWLLAGNSITGLDALYLYDCWALAQRIADLRSDGYQIVSENIKTPSGKRIARYSLQKPSTDE